MLIFAALTYTVFLIATGFFRNPRRTLLFTGVFLVCSIPTFQWLVLTSVSYRGVEHFQRVCVFGALGVSATFLFLCAGLRLRPASWIQSINVVGNFFLIFLYTTILSSFFVNSSFDNGIGREESVLAVSKEVFGGEGAEVYFVLLRSWRPDGGEEGIPVSKEEFEKTTPGQTQYVVTVKPGRLGLEWIAAHRVNS